MLTHSHSIGSSSAFQKDGDAGALASDVPDITLGPRIRAAGPYLRSIRKISPSRSLVRPYTFPSVFSASTLANEPR
jgi:hypothetical protein